MTRNELQLFRRMVKRALDPKTEIKVAVACWNHVCNNANRAARTAISLDTKLRKANIRLTRKEEEIEALKTELNRRGLDAISRAETSPSA